jgi:hypothetical protein
MILEDIRVECMDSDGKKLCKPIKVGAPTPKVAINSTANINFFILFSPFCFKSHL